MEQCGQTKKVGKLQLERVTLVLGEKLDHGNGNLSQLENRVARKKKGRFIESSDLFKIKRYSHSVKKNKNKRLLCGDLVCKKLRVTYVMDI